MIPKEIAIQLVQLKEKAKSYSSIQRSLDAQGRRDNVDKFKDEVEKINTKITNLAEKTNNILVDGLITHFEIETWFQGLKDKSVFLETNPRLIYEEEQRELEKQKKIAEKKAKQELEELEWQKMVEAENAIKEVKEQQKRLEAQQKEKQEEIERQLRDSEVEAQQKREELARQKRKDEESARQKQREIERRRQVAKEKAKKEAEERQKKLQAQRIQEFKEMCQYSFGENIYKLKKLIKEGLDINNIKDFDCLQSCISWGKSLAFIQFLVDSGILVKNKHIEYCYANLKQIKNSASIISILEEAKNIEILAVKNIRKRNKIATIGTISMVCICIFLLFMPQILNSEIDNFYYILVGIITIISLLMAINFIVDLRKKSKITNTIHLHGNQLPHRKQSEYEMPNAQGILGIAGSVKEFNHKEIKIKKMILWIVVTLISISIIALIYIFFEEIIDFIKVLLIFVIVISVLAWGMKNKR